jgi:hypothetical protein
MNLISLDDVQGVDENETAVELFFVLNWDQMKNTAKWGLGLNNRGLTSSD